jgi:hypothetical protein
VNVKGKIISTLLVIDTFFVSFAAGFNSRHVLIVDPNMPAYVAKPEPSASSDADKQGSAKQDSKADKATGKADKSTDKTANGADKGDKGAHATGAKGPGASTGTGAGGTASTNANSGASESKDGKKGTKSGSKAVHKPAHLTHSGTQKKAEAASQ